MRNKIVSIIIVPIPITRLMINEPVSLSPNIFFPKKYPQMKERNIREINPKPNARVNRNSYFSFNSASSSGSANLISFVIS
jgi:hypothetical protein